MKLHLTDTEKKEVERRHKKARDSRVCECLKAVLLCSEGWLQKQIAQTLRIRDANVSQHLQDWNENEKVKQENVGSRSLLSAIQRSSLISHLEETNYDKLSAIYLYVKKEWNLEYSVSSMTKWLRQNGSSYKRPKGKPYKANKFAQAEFHEKYIELISDLPANEVIEFIDGFNPTMATKITYAWIRKGKDKLISTAASRTRVNLFGSINLSSMDITIDPHKTIDSDAIEQHFVELRSKYKEGIKIHLILDRGSYNTSDQRKSAAKKYGVILHRLTAYSPNLNPIERLWKVMNEQINNNKFFSSTRGFKSATLSFLQFAWLDLKYSMKPRINDNFQTL